MFACFACFPYFWSASFPVSQSARHFVDSLPFTFKLNIAD